MRILLASLLALATPAIAQVDGKELADRIADAQSVIWPEQTFAIRLDGCQLYVRDAASNDRDDVRDATWFLPDFETDPDQLIILGQPMSDGTITWVDANVMYPLKVSQRNKYATDIARYEAALAELDDAANSGWSWFWRSGPTSAEIYDLSVQLADERRAGVYGPLLQRNFGIAEGEDMLNGPYYEPYGLIDTDLGFTFRDDVMDEILTDLHQYRLENCPPPD